MFVALVPPEDAREDLSEFLEPRVGHPWIHPDQWHITLAFLPEVTDRVVDGLAEGLEAAAARRTPMDLRLAGAGAFPGPWAAKVLWMGVRGDVDELDRLSVNVRNAAQHAGATPDGQAFRPHLTVSRLRSVQEQTKWVRILDTYNGPQWVADEIVLVASFLREGPNGRPRYETVASARLRGEDPVDQAQ